MSKEEVRAVREARLKTIEDVLMSETCERHAYVPELDCKIAFKKPTIADLKQITDITDPFERAKQYVFLLWSKADPAVTLEKVEQLPGDAVLAIARAFDQASAPFLPKSSTASSTRGEAKTSTS
jgi:hypothetical protein